MRERWITYTVKDVFGNDIHVRMLILNPALARKVDKASKGKVEGSFLHDVASLKALQCELTDHDGNQIPLDEIGQDESSAVYQGYLDTLKGGASKKPAG